MLKTKSLLFYALVLLLIGSCNSGNKTNVKQSRSDTETSDSVKTLLQDELNAKKANWAAKASEEKKRIYAEGIAAVENSGILQTAVQVGDTAPNFTLNTITNKELTLYDALMEGPVVLTWYRGGWCPYCNMTLHRLQEELPYIQAEGASLIALSPERMEDMSATQDKHQLTFDVASDIGNKVGKQFGIVFKLTDEVAKIYQENFDLHTYNGDESDELPLAATYIIGKNRVVQYAFLNADYRNRAEPFEIVEELKLLRKKK
ncbi:MAG: peroxiredoxin-like family protein [Bacteroidia bacterium]